MPTDRAARLSLIAAGQGRFLPVLDPGRIHPLRFWKAVSGSWKPREPTPNG